MTATPRSNARPRPFLQGWWLLGLLTIAGSLFQQCTKEDRFLTSPDARLEFSTDTLRFDTVFTQLGSATRFLKVYNRHRESILISRIHLEEGAGSRFRLNVDGRATNDARDVVVFPEDSIYVFVEVTIDPDQPLSLSPFVLHERLLFETNGNEQAVVLEAWGQNANYIPSRFHKDSIVQLSCNGAEIVWDDPKPYVLYGILVLDDCTLRIPAGARIHVHGGVSRGVFNGEEIIYNSGRLVIGPRGRLVVEGTPEAPVVIQGDRLEEEFQEADGQWTGLVLSAGAEADLQWMTLKNSLLGIWVDSAAELRLRNSRIHNTTGVGLLGLHARIEAENCLLYNNGGPSVQLVYGGEYDFTYCTLASFGVNANALEMSNFLCSDPLCAEAPPRIHPLDADFTNCIIFGSRQDEILLGDITGQDNPFDFNYRLENCIVRVQDLTDPDKGGHPEFFTFCDPCINAAPNDPLFVDANADDYHLDTLSIAEGLAKPLPHIAHDLDNQPRDPQTPDIGCFEYRPE